jgi:hypothetical protein
MRSGRKTFATTGEKSRSSQTRKTSYRFPPPSGSSTVRPSAIGAPGSKFQLARSVLGCCGLGSGDVIRAREEA